MIAGVLLGAGCQPKVRPDDPGVIVNPGPLPSYQSVAEGYNQLIAGLERLWTYQSVRDLKLNYFPWWSIATINRTIQDLVTAKLLTVDNFNDRKYDKTRWLSLA